MVLHTVSAHLDSFFFCYVAGATMLSHELLFLGLLYSFLNSLFCSVKLNGSLSVQLFP